MARPRIKQALKWLMVVWAIAATVLAAAMVYQWKKAVVGGNLRRLAFHMVMQMPFLSLECSSLNRHFVGLSLSDEDRELRFAAAAVLAYNGDRRGVEASLEFVRDVVPRDEDGRVELYHTNGSVLSSEEKCYYYATRNGLETLFGIGELYREYNAAIEEAGTKRLIEYWNTYKDDLVWDKNLHASVGQYIRRTGEGPKPGPSD